MQEDKRAFANRLKAAMRAKGMPPRASVLARALNSLSTGRPITPHGVGRWLRAETFPRDRVLRDVGRVLGVDWRVLRYGGLAGIQVREPSPEPGWRAHLGPSDRDMMDAYLRLPPRQRHVVREVIQALAVAHMGTKP